MASIKIILVRIMATLVLLVETKCCASTSSRPAKPPSVTVTAAAQNDFYCRKDACPGGVANVGCHCGTGYVFGLNCTGKAAQRITMDQRMKDYILREHNVKRNLLACGSVEPFEPAARMAEVTWDAELEHLAWCNVRQCVYGHDQCRSTRAFHFAGQNIAQRTACSTGGGAGGGGKVPPPMKPEETIHKSISSWFLEHRNATLAMLDHFPANVTSGPISHFTVMVNERVRRMACALVAYHEQRPVPGYESKRMVCLVHYFVCNYSHTNFVQQKTYTKAPEPVQNCSIYSADYSCLCSSREPWLATIGSH